jgi:hypothetical protein
MRATVADRIFAQGKDANGADIGLAKYGGEYSPSYLSQRKKKGLQGSKVILQSGAQSGMKTDFSVINDGKDLGLGFLNEHNADKSEWVEDTYNKEIFKSTKDEIKLANAIFEKNVKELLNG